LIGAADVLSLFLNGCIGHSADGALRIGSAPYLRRLEEEIIIEFIFTSVIGNLLLLFGSF
jgi:hypothetical protein